MDSKKPNFPLFSGKQTAPFFMLSMHDQDMSP